MPLKTCTFFGHRDTPDSIRPILHNVLINLIELQGTDTFYVGNQGNFDSMVHSELKELSKVCSHIRYFVVLAYLPKKKDINPIDFSDTVYPDGLENVPAKFAIDKRNRLMLERSDIVVTYVRGSAGGAAKFKDLAVKKGKRVINLHL
ncbi:MAG: hypothetical protein MJ177_01600 [Clostridia bacterium]|nr:hypothetical protein [Clostridia bacterium]